MNNLRSSLNHFARIACGVVLAAAVLASPAHAAPYTWTTVRIGGCGNVTSVKAHPKVQNLFFITTDVGNSYRWNNAAQCWEPLLNSLGAAYWAINAAGDLAFDPNDTTGNILYATIGRSATNDWDSVGKVIKSTNRGNTWTDTGLSIWVGANNDQGAGDRIAVDPQNSSVVWVTTRAPQIAPTTANGTFKSTNAGATWTQVNSLFGNFVVFDVSGGTLGGVTKNILIGCSDGVYRSTDGGANFSLMSGSPVNLYKGSVHSNGTLYGTSLAGGVYKCVGTTWTTITPPAGSAYQGIAVNPSNSAQVLVCDYNGDHYRSTDSGATWTSMPKSQDLTEVPFFPGNIGLNSNDFCFDPFNASHVWFTDFFDVHETQNVWASTVAWKARAVGHEELVTTGTLLCPPSGVNLLHSSAADMGGFDHTSLTSPPTQCMTKFFPWSPTDGNNGNMTGVAVEETNPNYIVRVGRHGWDGVAYAGYSTDGGLTYTLFNSPDPSRNGGGRIAVSATSQTMVWVQQSGHAYRSTDRGTTWTQLSAALDNAVGGGWNVFAAGGINPIAADKVNGNKFYIYNAGTLYVSTDGGATFNAAASNLPQACNTCYATLESTPGREGDLWFGVEGIGLYHSTDSGTSFTQVANVQSAKLIAVGKAASTTPAIYVFGTVNNIANGTFRSDDNGATWTEIDDPNYSPGTYLSMAADRNVYGRVFISAGGNGIMYGVPSGTSVPPAPTGLTATGGNTQISLSWTASSGATSYKIYSGTISGGEAFAGGTTTGTSFIATGAVNGTTYYYKVTAVNASGESGFSNEAFATAGTGNATNIFGTVTPTTVDGGADNSVELGCKFKSDVAGQITAVRFYKSAANTGTHTGTLWSITGTQLATVTFSGETASGWQTATFPTAVNITANTDYVISYHSTTAHYAADQGYFASSAHDNPPLHALKDGVDGANGVYSYGASTVFPTSTFNQTNYYVDVVFSQSAAPAAPTGLTATAGNAQVALSWTASSGATSYNVKRSTVNGSGYATVSSPTTTSYTNTGLTNGTTYYYVVTAVNATGESAISSQASATPVAVPAAPTGLAAVPGIAQAWLTWSGSTGAASYTVKRSTVSGSGYANVATGVAATNYMDTGVTNGTTYYYVVSAVNASGASANSAQASATPSATVPQAQLPNGTATIDGTVEAAWNNATAYLLSKATGTISSPADCTATWKGMWDNTNLYILADVTDDVKINDSVNPWDDDSVEVYLDADHNGGTAYDANDRQIDFGWNDAAPVEGGSRAITGVSFAKADPTSTSYRIEAKIPWTVEAFTPAANTVIGIDVHINDDDDGGARDGKIIWNDGTDQAWTNPSLFGAAKLLGGAAPPTAPTGLTATAGNTQIALSWTASSGATSYNVKRSTVSGSGYATVSSPTTTSYTNTGLTNGTSYYYVVTAVNANGESGNSSQVSAVPAPTSIWSTNPTPATIDVNDGTTGIDVGVRFRSDIAGKVKGIRFYKASTNTGTHTGTLWSNTGTQLATITFTGETASGWQQMLFSTPVNIAANTTYVASYHANNGHYSANSSYFATAAFNNAPLHALQNGTDANGVYLYGAGFPTQTFNSTNYWVDIVFSP